MKSNLITRLLTEIIKKTLTILRSIVVYLGVAFLIFFFLSFFVGISGLSQPTSKKYYAEKEILNQGGDQKIVIANLSGMILSSAQSSLFVTEDIISPERIENIFLQAKSDPQVKAIIFDIYSPGGSPVASDRIYELINNFKNDTKIPVIFLLSDLAASGAYYIASASDFIIANPASLTGSIGVIMETYNLEGLYDKIGVSKNTFKQGEYKDILSESRDITDEETEIINALNQNTYDLFVSRVADGRRLDLDYVRSLADGKILSGKQAYELKLIDGLGNTDEAVYQAKKLANLDRAIVVKYQKTSLWAELMGAPTITSALNQVLYLPSQIWQQK